MKNEETLIDRLPMRYGQNRHAAFLIRYTAQELKRRPQFFPQETLLYIHILMRSVYG